MNPIQLLELDSMEKTSLGPILDHVLFLFFRDAYFLTRNPNFGGKHSFSAFPFFFPYFPSFEKKNTSFFWGGTKIIIPGWSMHHIEHKHTIRSGLRAVIFSNFHSTTFLPDTVSTNSSSCSSLYRVTELLSRIKNGNRGIFSSDF